MTKKQLLIIGTIPLPIGGVTIHTQRILRFLTNDDFCYEFLDYKRSGKLRLLTSLFKNDVIHSHVSREWVRALLVLLVKLFRKKIIITFHGRYNFSNLFDRFALKYADYPLLLNRQTMECAIKYTDKALLTSAFVPPSKITPLPPVWHEKIKALKRGVRKLFCTNAFDVSFDKNGRELYGISSVVEIFNKFPDLGLIVSDPSSNYKKFLHKTGVSTNDNILIINEPHDYVSVIMISDVSVRATTSDGDSLSVKESLFMDTPVIASDCVDRPKGCILFETGNKNALENMILEKSYHSAKQHEIINAYDDLLALYQQILN